MPSCPTRAAQYLGETTVCFQKRRTTRARITYRPQRSCVILGFYSFFAQLISPLPQLYTFSDVSFLQLL